MVGTYAVARGPMAAAGGIVTFTARSAMIIPISLVVSLAAERANPAPSTYRRLIVQARQALVVTTTDWNSVNGTLTRFEKISTGWSRVGEEISVVVGKNGLAWDAVTVAHGIRTEFIKREGDGRSPAGIFLLKQEFGFDSSPVTNKMQYLPLTGQIECVDDVKSRSYNEVVNRNLISLPDWHSSEKMREVEQYKLGIIVGYNPGDVKSAGSCIFLHIWRGPGNGTAGCTAMEEMRLRQITKSLDEKKHPILIQLPAAVYKRLRNPWRLP